MNASSFPWRLSVAPMMDWTDRHCRYFHRLLTTRARLYTEMVTTGALLHGDVARHLDFDPVEQPVALQLGGSEPADLAACARLGERWGYAEINLNCGCPSERVQRGAFGACLMAEPALVADGVKAMRDAVAIPVTVKHRIGIDRSESYAFVRDFVGTVAEGGCEVFIVHARNAWLHGISPKENRELPPLRHEVVALLKRDFPALAFVLNGGVADGDAIAAQLARRRRRDGRPRGLPPAVGPRRVGRALLRRARDRARRATTSRRRWSTTWSASSPRGEPWSHASRHMLGLRNGEPGARRWRQVWSDHRLKNDAPRNRRAPRARGACRRPQPRRRAGHAASATPASASANAAACDLVNSSP